MKPSPPLCKKVLSETTLENIQALQTRQGDRRGPVNGILTGFLLSVMHGQAVYLIVLVGRLNDELVTEMVKKM